jgi:hypothetical protein
MNLESEFWNLRRILSGGFGCASCIITLGDITLKIHWGCSVIVLSMYHMRGCRARAYDECIVFLRSVWCIGWGCNSNAVCRLGMWLILSCINLGRPKKTISSNIAGKNLFI